MKPVLISKFYRLLFVLVAVSLLAFSLPGPGQAAAKTYAIEITGVEKNQRITVTASGFPPNTDFAVRVGPFSDFTKLAAALGKVNSGSTGSFVFNITLPKIVKDVKQITVRLDSSLGHYSYNVFTNATSGKIEVKPNAWLPTNPSPSPTPTPTPAANACSIVSTQPSKSVPPKADFDAVWVIKNTGTKEWNLNSTDYKYASGEKLYKRKALYDLPKTVKPSESIQITVDMIAPAAAGTYKTEWMVAGSLAPGVCSLPLTLTVK